MRQYYINLGYEPIIKDNKYICLNCGKIIKRKKAKKYCSFKCNYKFATKHSHQLLRNKLIKENNFKCNKCKHKFSSDRLILDHKLPIALGGKEFDENNLQILCIPCHKIKTAQDFRDISYSKRLNKQKLMNKTLDEFYG